MSSATRCEASIDGTLATITISTEGGLNVMSTDVMKQLGDCVARVASEKSVRFAVIRAEGKVFVAGADIKEMSGFDSAAGKAFGELGSSVCDAIERLPCITIAALQGAALGGGFEIALACDYRLAIASAKIGLPETTLGLLPGWGGIPRTVRLTGRSRATRMIFSGRPIAAEQGATMGLIDEVAADADALDELVRSWCGSFVKGSPAAVALVKRALRDGEDVAAFADCFDTSESREGMAAFAEKRAADWAKG